jgi:hypothetical protein
MKTQIASWAAWILVRIQIVTATLDPAILQWPGGIVIALLLWLYVDRNAGSALRDHRYVLPPP